MYKHASSFILQRYLCTHFSTEDRLSVRPCKQTSSALYRTDCLVVVVTVLCDEACNNELGVLSDQHWPMEGGWGGGACTTESKGKVYFFCMGILFSCQDYGVNISLNICRINSLDSL